MEYQNPYANLSGGRWLKTNFHTHAGIGREDACGKHPIDFVLGLYRGLNYGALCISNHDMYTDTSPLTDEKMYLVQGVEYSRDEHMLTVGVHESLHEMTHQEAIDETSGQGGFTILCHPNWIHKEYWPYEKIDGLRGFAGIEVINMLVCRLSGSGLAADTWDHLLRQGKLVFGFGNDDFHEPFDAGRSYTDIYAESRDFKGIGQAVAKGSFVASTGLCLEYLELEGKVIRVKAKFPVQTYVDSFHYKFITENGLSRESYGGNAYYEINGENYVRVEVMAENGALLFTQPVYKKSFFNKP